jgi:hypothetical protein
VRIAALAQGDGCVRYQGEDEAIFTAPIGTDTPRRLTATSGVCCPV